MPSRSPRGVVSEIFRSLQGEGIYVGEPQVFVRLAGCPLRCRYCDTPQHLRRNGRTAMRVAEVLRRVRRLDAKKLCRTVSVTGGEPLMQAEFLTALLPALRRAGRRTYLETSGVHPHLLRRVVRDCDVVAMDIKCPGDTGKPYWTEHREFLAVAGKKAFVKIVLTSKTTEAEVRKAVELVADARPRPPLVLQPVTPVRDRRHGGALRPPSPERLAAIFKYARRRLSDVRLVPQMHRLWGLP